MLHIGFTGTRYGCKPDQLAVMHMILDDLDDKGPMVAHHGDCIGADAEFHAEARRLRWSVTIHPPIDETHRAHCKDWRDMADPLPHMQRNKAIVASADVMIACPFDATEQSRGGTWKTIGFARKAARPLAIVWPDGTVTKERWR